MFQLIACMFAEHSRPSVQKHGVTMWISKGFNDARGSLNIKIAAQILVGVKIGFIEIGKWVTWKNFNIV